MIFLPADKTNVVNWFRGGKSTGEIAERLGVRRATIETVLREAFAHLFDMVNEDAAKIESLAEGKERAEVNDPRHGESIHTFFQD